MKKSYILLILILTLILSSSLALTFSIKNIAKESHTLPSPKHANIYVVAHRGAHNGIPENSLPAYQKAIDLGVDFVEVDIRTTSDGEIISCHNSEIDAYTIGETGRINDFTLAELKHIDIGIKKGPEWENTRIPTLDEILQLCQGKCGIYLDLKEAPIEQIIILLRKYDMESQALWYSPSIRFHMFYKLKKNCPECIPMPDPIYKQFLPFTLKVMKPRVVATVWDSFSPEFSRSCKDAGVLSIMDEDNSSSDEWNKAIEWGVNGIQTDDPEALIDFLKMKEKKKK